MMPQFDLRLIYIPQGYCNYRCAFCHQEGVNLKRSQARGLEFVPREVRWLVEWLLPRGLVGVTISGGEPLIQIGNVIQVWGRLPQEVPVTLVTNGTRLRRLVPFLQAHSYRNIRININLPSFNRGIFSSLSGQDRYAPNDIVKQICMLSNLDIEVNLNCVLCKGVNDRKTELYLFANHAVDHGANARFLVQGDANRSAGTAIADAFDYRGPFQVRRGGRVRRFPFRDSFIEVVWCETEPPQNANVALHGVADIYWTTHGSLKLGLWGREVPVKHINEMLSFLARYMEDAI